MTGRSAPALLRRPLLWIQLAWIAMLLGFAVGIPIYQAPDEVLHIDRVLAAGRDSGFGEFDERSLSPELTATYDAGFRHRNAPYGAMEAPGGERWNLDALESYEGNQAPDQLAQHPPAYYALTGAVRTAIVSMLPDDTWDFDREVLLLRLLNVAMVAPLPWLCARTARTLGMGVGSATLASLVPLCIPQLAHIGASVNNDNLLLLTSSVTVAAAAEVLSSRLTWGRTLVIGTSVMLALWTKAPAIALVPLVVVVAVQDLRRRRSDWPMVAALGGFLVAGSLYYVRSLLLHGDPVAGRDMGLPSRTTAFQPVDFTLTAMDNFSQSFWGKFGWLWVDLPGTWVHLLSVGLVACVVVAAWRRPIRGVATLLVVPATAAVLIFGQALRGHLATGLHPAQQGRYMFFTLVPVAVALASVLGRLGHERLVRVSLGSLVVVNFSLAVWVVGRGMWQGPGVPTRLDALSSWNALGPAGSWVVVACILAVPGALVAGELLGFSRRERAGVLSTVP